MQYNDFLCSHECMCKDIKYRFTFNSESCQSPQLTCKTCGQVRYLEVVRKHLLHRRQDESLYNGCSFSSLLAIFEPEGNQ